MATLAEAARYQPADTGRRTCAVTLFGVWAACSAIGCSSLHGLEDFARWEQGYTLVLPGIEGRGLPSTAVASGLRAGGVPTAIEVHDWTTGNPGLMLVHLRYLSRNKRQAQLLADKIVAYQDKYPGRPVNLVGHSGGGAMALLTLEALPPDRTVDSVLLLAPAISPDFDLRTALRKTRNGVWNFSSYGDIRLLIIGTTVAGTVDGKHMPSAGAVGFRLPADLTDEERQLYGEKLHEVPFEWQMVQDWHLSGHFGCTTPSFARHRLAPLLTRGQPESLADLTTSADGRAESEVHQTSAE